MRQVDNWEVTPTRDGVSALTGEGAELEVPENVQADLRKRAEQEGGPVSASASVRFSHDLVTRETDSRVNVPKRDVASRATAIAAAAKADPWEEGGALSGALNPQYAKIRDVLQEKQQQSRVARRRGGRRRDDLKDRAYKMPQIVIEQEPASFRRVGLLRGGKRCV